jgi:hypothetical protein
VYFKHTYKNTHLPKKCTYVIILNPGWTRIQFIWIEGRQLKVFFLRFIMTRSPSGDKPLCQSDRSKPNHAALGVDLFHVPLEPGLRAPRLTAYRVHGRRWVKKTVRTPGLVPIGRSPVLRAYACEHRFANDIQPYQVYRWPSSQKRNRNACKSTRWKKTVPYACTRVSCD